MWSQQAIRSVKMAFSLRRQRRKVLSDYSRLRTSKSERVRTGLAFSVGLVEERRPSNLRGRQGEHRCTSLL